MTTKKIYIDSISNNGVEHISQKCVQHSYAFRHLYKCFELSVDRNFIDECLKRFNLNYYEYTSLKSEVKSFINKEETQNKKKLNRINDLSYDLENKELSKRQKYKIYNRIAYLKQTLRHQPVFGSKHILVELTKAYNAFDEKRIIKLRKEFKESRIRPIFIIGESNQKGNRFFDFSKLTEGVIVYKPQKWVKYELNIHIHSISKSWMKDFIKLIELTENKELSVSVTLTDKFICLTYDEEKLNGYHLNENERRKDVQDIKKLKLNKEVEKERIKEIYREYYRKQEEKKLQGKIEGRCLSIDMNPTNIGWSVIDLKNKETGEYKVIAGGVIDFSWFCNKRGWSSNDVRQKRLNNKRKYEISIALKKLFGLVKHYRCSKFIMEDLDFKSDQQMNKESNRKNKNLWNRDFITKIIERRCNETGVILEKVNACYSSFIGNIQHPFVDACNASIEIGRRGLMKFNGMFYPYITDKDIDTVNSKFGTDAQYGTFSNWIDMYKSLKKSMCDIDFSHRLRTTLDVLNKTNYSMFSMESIKSRTKFVIFKI